MHFSEANEAEETLSRDLSLLVRSVKAHQEQHNKCLDYNQGIISNRSYLQSTLFIHDDIKQFKAFLKKVTAAEAILKAENATVLARHHGVCITTESTIILIKRSISKIIQMIQQSISLIKEPTTFHKAVTRTKNQLLNLLNDKSSLRFGLILQILLNYCEHKLHNQILRLQGIINLLQQGQVSELINLSSPKSTTSQIIPTEKTIKRQVFNDVCKQQKQKIKRRVALIRQEAKDNEIARLGKRKVIKNILKTMTDVMLLSSGQFLEDAVQQNKEEQIARLMSELIARNKANSVSIEQFKNKQTEFEHMLRNQQHFRLQTIDHNFDNKRTSLKQSQIFKPTQYELQRECCEDLIKPNLLTNCKPRILCGDKIFTMQRSKRIDLTSSIQPKSSMASSLQQSMLNQKNSKIYKKQRATLNEIQSINNIETQHFHSQKKMNFGTDFVDINTKTPMEHRDRLPEIYHRVASVDTQKYRKTREDKEIGSESKKNVKNVDLGTGGGTLNSSSILKSRQKMDIRTSRNLKIQMKTEGNYFAEIGKLMSQMGDRNCNLLS